MLLKISEFPNVKKNFSFVIYYATNISFVPFEIEISVQKSAKVMLG